jgi:hypothetical protein
MRWGSGATIATALAAAFLVPATGALAATEVGEPCVANGTEANRTLLVFTGATTPLIQPVVPEEPPQVITGWKLQVGPGVAPLPQRLEVYRVLNEAQDYRKEAESATETVSEGVNFFPTRIPVQGWTGYLALYGPSGTLACNSVPAGVAGAFEGAAGLGETKPVKSAIGLGVPVMATIEDDRDRDGYGDLTQDKCPKGAAYQGECPRVTLGLGAVARRRSILVSVRASSETPVHVFGQVGWGFKPKPKTATHRSRHTNLIVGLAGGTKTVTPGKPTRFTIKLPKAVMRRLGRLTPQESLKAKLTARTTDLAGRVTDRRLTVKLVGQAPARSGASRPVRSPRAGTLRG